jgi:hypothetical protein
MPEKQDMALVPELLELPDHDRQDAADPPE